MDTAAKAPGNSTSSSFEIAIFCLTGVCLGVTGTVESDVSDGVVVKGGSRYGRGGAVSRKFLPLTYDDSPLLDLLFNTTIKRKYEDKHSPVHEQINTTLNSEMF
ncbi:unnamed protein product [Rotaria sordida]|uniref:Uncharacterized protein n=1 Tax=Rotaria sordida TaxID=392033 RepID=A0A819GZG6_9BILA|nr:unnamed protein product [Rotaria sordida]